MSAAREIWRRSEQIDAETIIDTDVTLNPPENGLLIVEVNVVRHLLAEAGYQEVTPTDTLNSETTG